jgi:hypothetical protein
MELWPILFREIHTLNVEQVTVMNLAMSGHNVFIGGKPGTGKTWIYGCMPYSLKSRCSWTASLSHRRVPLILTEPISTSKDAKDSHLCFILWIYGCMPYSLKSRCSWTTSLSHHPVPLILTEPISKQFLTSVRMPKIRIWPVLYSIKTNRQC